MPSKSFAVEVDKALIQWTINTSGETVDQISAHTKIKSQKINSWITGDNKPTYSQLENLAAYLKRPVAVFFLPKPPEEKKPPKDYRMLPNKSDKFSKVTLLAIRKARRLQSISKELVADTNIAVGSKIATVSLKDNPVTIASKERLNSGIDINIQKKWATSNESLNEWKVYIESKDILVFQMTMNIQDARGFSIADDTPYVIVLNSSDTPEARTFTLMHEYAHILLRESGVCLTESNVQTPNTLSVEKWCNDFAAAFLLPMAEIKSDFELNKGKLLDDLIFKKLLHKYKVSRQMLILQMVKQKYLPQKTYDNIVESMKNKKKSAAGGFVPPDVKCIQQYGKKFVSLVSSNLAKGNITNYQALDYLSVKVKTLNKVIKRSDKYGRNKK